MAFKVQQAFRLSTEEKHVYTFQSPTKMTLEVNSCNAGGQQCGAVVRLPLLCQHPIAECHIEPELLSF